MPDSRPRMLIWITGKERFLSSGRSATILMSKDCMMTRQKTVVSNTDNFKADQ